MRAESQRGLTHNRAFYNCGIYRKTRDLTVSLPPEVPPTHSQRRRYAYRTAIRSVSQERLMRTPTALVIVLLGLLLQACSDSTTNTSTPASLAPATSVLSETASPPDTESSPGTEPAGTSPNTESPDSDGPEGITQEEDQLIPPIAPNPPTLEATSDGLVIKWRGTGPDLLSYLVYHRRAPSDPWAQMAEVSPVGDNLGDYSHVIAEESNQTGEYAIVAVDIDGNRSPFSAAIRAGG